MSKNKEMLSGIFPPVMTPFNSDQTLDYDALAYNIQKMNKTNIRGLMPLGSNGEFHSLSDEESLEVIRVIKKNAAPDKVIMAGGARESAYTTVEFIKAMCQEGVDLASVLTPSYFASSMKDDALINYFTYVADRSPVPIVLYCAPKFANNVTITPEALSVLCKHPNIAGMKDTSSGDIKNYTDAVPDGEDFYLQAGSINKYLYGLEVGAVGGILSIANYLPDECCRITELYNAGQKEEAKKLSDHLIALSSESAGKYGVKGVKAAMDLLGYKGGFPRIPLLPLEDSVKEVIKQVFVREGYIK